MKGQDPICKNSCSDLDLKIKWFMETFHNHGIMVTDGVAEEWLKGDDKDEG